MQDSWKKSTETFINRANRNLKYKKWCYSFILVKLVFTLNYIYLFSIKNKALLSSTSDNNNSNKKKKVVYKYIPRAT